MTDKLRAAAEQALEALNVGIMKMNALGCAIECMPLHYANKALREALAEPALEPVDLDKAFREELDKGSHRNYELRMENARLKASNATPLLTDAEILAIMRGGNNCNYNDEGEHVDFARAIEQAVRNKAGII